MNKIILLIAVGFLFSSIYFFFIQRELFAGSVSLVLCLVFNLIFAMMSNVNRVERK